jgi:DNA-binding NtrC family response regulator
MTTDSAGATDDRPRPRILVVDDDEDVLVLLRHRLEHLGYAVTIATGGTDAIEQLVALPPALVLLDLRLPRMSGLEVLRRVKQLSPETPVVVMTAFATVEKAVEAMREGARDFLTKPLTPGHLEVVIQKAFEAEALARTHRLVQEELDAKTQSIIGDSAALREAIERARRAAASPSTVLLLGESGTGKEIFARAIHTWSPRRACPFVVINCAALSEELIASDLFGHERGAFTGAHQRRQGKLELAAGGTVFLDEIGEMHPSLQTRLLRVLQDHTFERVGGTAPMQVDIRVISATNRDLTQAVKSGDFREDLFFRLNVIPIALPPLRERRSDIRPLAEFFLRQHGVRLKRPGLTLSPRALDALQRYHWPGNIRELENLLERAVVLSRGDELNPEDLALPALEPAEPVASSPYQARLDAAEKAMLQQALRHCAGNRRAAARAMGIALSTLYAKLKKHGLS